MVRSRRSLPCEKCARRPAWSVAIEALVAATLVRDDPRALLLVPVYLGRVTSGTLRAGDDAAEARAFPVGDLPLLGPAYEQCQLDTVLERWPAETTGT